QPPLHPRFRTVNQSYGSRAPSVYELPNCFHCASHSFSTHLGKCGMYSDSGLNTALDKSRCTGSDSFITACERRDFHPSYNRAAPSLSSEQPP
ncbi:CI116 protein, partial [Spelaeornis formosus]|nr:CI116 protein [Elachura formosa]